MALIGKSPFEFSCLRDFRALLRVNALEVRDLFCLIFFCFFFVFCFLFFVLRYISREEFADHISVIDKSKCAVLNLYTQQPIPQRMVQGTVFSQNNEDRNPHC